MKVFTPSGWLRAVAEVLGIKAPIEKPEIVAPAPASRYLPVAPRVFSHNWLRDSEKIRRAVEKRLRRGERRLWNQACGGWRVLQKANPAPRIKVDAHPAG